MKQIGFIGLGNMGRPMAKNLIKAGYQVQVFDLVKEAVDDLLSCGAKAAKTCKEAAAGADVLITMLPNSPHVEGALFGPEGAAESLKSGALYIDMSSISPIVTQKLVKTLTAKGIKVMDAPVTGGVAGAESGSLGIMTGAEDSVMAEARPILEVLGKKIIHVGGPGMGQTAKVCNQIIVGISFCACSEAMVLGTKAGIDPAKLQEILNSGSAHCWALEARIPKAIQGDFDPGFMIDLQHKDIGLALETGKELHVPLNFAALAYQTYEAARAEGYGGLDHSAVMQVLERIAGHQVRVN